MGDIAMASLVNPIRATGSNQKFTKLGMEHYMEHSMDHYMEHSMEHYMEHYMEHSIELYGMTGKTLYTK